MTLPSFLRSIHIIYKAITIDTSMTNIVAMLRTFELVLYFEPSTKYELCLRVQNECVDGLLGVFIF